MGRAAGFAFTFHPIPGGTQVSFGPDVLRMIGFNIPVEVATAGAFVSSSTNPATRKSILVTAHLDTGASQTTISHIIAQHLGLIQLGVGQTHTASGPASNPTYAIDLSFVGTNLRPRVDLPIGSCTLPFVLGAPASPTNFGVLIGRDILSSWHMMWDGPSSTVIISE